MSEAQGLKHGLNLIGSFKMAARASQIISVVVVAGRYMSLKKRWSFNHSFLNTQRDLCIQ